MAQPVGMRSVRDLPDFFGGERFPVECVFLGVESVPSGGNLKGLENCFDIICHYFSMLRFFDEKFEILVIETFRR